MVDINKAACKYNFGYSCSFENTVLEFKLDSMQTQCWIFDLLILLSVLCENTILGVKQTSMQTQCWIFHLPILAVVCENSQHANTMLDISFTNIGCCL